MATNTISRYQPQAGLTRLPDLMDRLFQESFVAPTVFGNLSGGTARPGMPVNLYETTDSYVLQVALPGINPDALDIQVMGREVSIKGHFEAQAPEKANWIWRGLPAGDFFETYSVPVEVEADKSQAAYEHGILSLTLPKADHVRPRNITVTTAR